MTKREATNPHAIIDSFMKRVIKKFIALPAARCIGADVCVNDIVQQVGSVAANTNRATHSTPDTVTGTIHFTELIMALYALSQKDAFAYAVAVRALLAYRHALRFGPILCSPLGNKHVT